MVGAVLREILRFRHIDYETNDDNNADRILEWKGFVYNPQAMAPERYEAHGFSLASLFFELLLPSDRNESSQLR